MLRNPSPQHFNIESPFPQSAKSSHEFASVPPGKNGNRSGPERGVSHQPSPAHKVKPFVHSQPLVEHPRSEAFFSPVSPMVSSHHPPSMADVIRHIDTETVRHKQSTSSTPSTSINTISSSPSAFTSFGDFEVTSNTAVTSTEQQEVLPRKDLFQLFQKVPEQFSLVTEVNQDFQVPDIENTIESSFINEEHNYHSSNELLDSSRPDDIKVSRVRPKIRQSFDSATSHTSSSTAKSLIESSTVRRRGILSDRVRASQNVDANNNERTTESANDSPPKPKKRFLLKSRSKQTKAAKTVTTPNKKTSFSSFPYRDNRVQTSARQRGDGGKKIKRKVQRHSQKLVSLEDKQENRGETLQRLLDIAGSGWSSEGGGGRRNSISRGQQQQQQQQQWGGEFEC